MHYSILEITQWKNMSECKTSAMVWLDVQQSLTDKLPSSSLVLSFLMITLPSSTLAWTKWSISSSEGMADVNYLLLCPTSERALDSSSDSFLSSRVESA